MSIDEDAGGNGSGSGVRSSNGNGSSSTKPVPAVELPDIVYRFSESSKGVKATVIEGGRVSKVIRLARSTVQPQDAQPTPNDLYRNITVKTGVAGEREARDYDPTTTTNPVVPDLNLGGPREPNPSIGRAASGATPLASVDLLLLASDPMLLTSLQSGYQEKLKQERKERFRQQQQQSAGGASAHDAPAPSSNGTSDGSASLAGISDTIGMPIYSETTGISESSAPGATASSTNGLAAQQGAPAAGAGGNGHSSAAYVTAAGAAAGTGTTIQVTEIELDPLRSTWAALAAVARDFWSRVLHLRGTAGSSGDDDDDEATVVALQRADAEHAFDGDRDVINPLAWGIAALVLPVLFASMLMAMADAREAARVASEVFAAARGAAGGVPAPWVQLDAMLGAASMEVQEWYTMTWRDWCNAVMERLSWLFQKWSYAPLPTKIASVLASSVPLVVAFGLAYHWAQGGTMQGGITIKEALVKIHCILNRMPGTNMVRENNAASFLVVNAAFFTGLFTFAVFLGIVSDEVKSTFRDIRTGAYPVRTADHVLILNWSHLTIPLLRQYGLARQHCAAHDAFFKRHVVLLADTPKQYMDNEIAERLKNIPLDVITRNGSPNMVRDLSTVAAASAHTIIVMHPSGASSLPAAEAAKASIAMALVASLQAQQQANVHALTGRPGPGVTPPRVLFQMPEELTAEQDPVTSLTRLAPQGMRMQALSVTDDNLIDRFTCQAAVQPGMLRIWMSVLQHGPHSVQAHVRAVSSDLLGSTFGVVRQLFRDAVVAGVLRNGVFSSNCDDMVLNGTDQLVLFTRAANPQPHPATTQLYSKAASAAAERLKRSSGYNAPTKRVIIAGCTAYDVQDVAAAFADSAPDGSTLAFILPEVPEGMDLPGGCGTCRLRYVESKSMTSLKALQEAGIKTADAVVLRPPIAEIDRFCNKATKNLGRMREADALVMAGIIQVQDAVLASGRSEPPHLVARFNRFGATETARKYFESLAQQYPPTPLQQQQQAAKPAAAGQQQQQPSKMQAVPAVLPQPWLQHQLPPGMAAPGGGGSSGSSGSTASAGAPGTSTPATTSSQPAPSGSAAQPAAASAASPTGAAAGSSSAPTIVSSSSSGAGGSSSTHPAAATAAAPAINAPMTNPVLVLVQAATGGGGSGSSTSAGSSSTSGGSSSTATASTAEAPNTSASGSHSGSSGSSGPAGQSSSSSSSSAGSATAASAASSSAAAASVAATGVTPLLPQQQQQAAGLMVLSATHAMMTGGPSALAIDSPPTTHHSTHQPHSSGPAATTSAGASSTTGTATSSSSSSGSSTSSGGSSGSNSSGSSTSSGGSSSTTPPVVKKPIIRNPEIFLADDLVAALLTQVAAQPSYSALLAQFIRRDGMELYLRNPAVFNIVPGDRVTFAELSESTRQLKQVALGVMKGDGRCCLVPQPDHVIDVEAGDQILVLGDEFKIRKK